MSTFEIKYVQWVQRTLNREVNAELITDGLTTKAYREAVETFQLIHDLPLTGDIGPADQNKLIKANHQATPYVNWAQVALHEVQAREKGTVTSTMDKETIENIKSFQAYHGLRDDGWIGARTEIALIEESGIYPGGHIRRGTPRPRRPIYNNPKAKPVYLPLEQAVNRIISTNYWDAMHQRVPLDAEDRLKRIKVLGKLKQRHGIDDRFPSGERIGASHRGSTKYRTAKSIFASAREYISKTVSHWPAEDRLSASRGRMVVRELIKSIDSGLFHLKLYQTSMRKSDHAYFPPLIAEAQEMTDELKDKPNSILHGYR